MRKAISWLFWLAVSCLGASAYWMLATRRSEPVGSSQILIAALCTYAVGYRFYSKWIAARVLMLDDRRATPCEAHDDGRDFVKTNKWIVFGHHFAAISGPGPLVGPVLAAQFGYLPGTLWILIGVAFGGAVQDFVILFASMRRDGKSLAQMVREELNGVAGLVSLAAILGILVILLAVLALVVVQGLTKSPWGVFTVGATIPIALFMGGYMRFWRVGKVLEASVLGVVLLLLAVWGGRFVHGSETWHPIFSLQAKTLAWSIIGYSLAASVLPVWLLLAPRDYLSTFMKLGTVFALAAGIFLVLPHLQMPALTRFVDGSGPVVPGALFPFCFITIACGAISGFHTLISSGTTPKIITRESYARPIGYGAMCLESLVAIMAIIAACILDPGVYLSINVTAPGADARAVAINTTAQVTALGFPVTPETMDQLAAEVGETTLYGRTGGAATLAVGMAQIFSKATRGRWLDLWYHFAIMFEALFILTTLDAGTRVGRYLLQDLLGHFWAPLRETRHLAANVAASLLIVAAWGFFLIQGVRDPDGGVRALWPLFGIANQLLAAIALCLATTILLKSHLNKASPATSCGRNNQRKPVVVLATLLPLVCLLAITMTAGIEKIFHVESRPNFPKIGFLQIARDLEGKRPALEKAVDDARAAGNDVAIAFAEKNLRANRMLHFNNRVDAMAALVFLILVSIITILSVREWILLLVRKREPRLCESPPVWLPDYAAAEGGRLRFLGVLALGLGLAKELTGETDMERMRAELRQQTAPPPSDEVHQDMASATPRGVSLDSEKRVYARMTEKRFQGVRRCC